MGFGLLFISLEGGPELSHLAFANDLVLFAEANMEQVEVINTCLRLFCNSFG